MKTLLKRIYRRCIGNRLEERKYQKWVRNHMQAILSDETSWDNFSRKPVYSIVVPLFCTPESFLHELVCSVRAQTYPKWELILSDGSGKNSPIRESLKRYENDPRIRVIHNSEQLDISENTNKALKLAKGEYIVFVDHDDVLPAYALYECTRAVCEWDEPDLIYSDEDKITMDGKKYFQPHFKPDFNLTLLRSMNYFCHLVVVKKSLQEKVGMLQSEYNGAQDYDFVLRCIEKTNRICHIPKILYHWRSHAGSIAGSGESKEYAFEAGRKALLAHYERCGIQADVRKGEIFGIYHTIFQLNKNPLVSIYSGGKAVPSSVLNRAGYDNYEVLISENIEDAAGKYILFLDADVQKVSLGWLKALLEQMMQPDTGIVGAHIYRADGRQKSAGIIVGGKDLFYRIAYKETANDVGYFGRNICSQEFSAVDGACVLISRELFLETGGIDSKLQGILGCVDLCLKARQKAAKVIYAPAVKVLVGKADEAVPERNEMEYFREKWTSFLVAGDPYYNCNQILKKHLFRID